jgi:hypothetical protein
MDSVVQFLQFLFIILVPIALVVGGLVSLFAVGALFDALEHPDDFKKRIEGAFRAGPAAARATRASHYYQPYWREDVKAR